MNRNKYIFVLLTFLVLFCGCSVLSTNYGKISYLRGTDDQTTIQDLIDTWEDYEVSYAGLGVKQPLGIMFNPKNNDTTLTGKRWKKVEDQETVIEVVRWIHPNTLENPELSKILGPAGKFYGYMYHSYGPVVLKQIDDNTMYVLDLEDPEMMRGGGNTIR